MAKGFPLVLFALTALLLMVAATPKVIHRVRRSHEETEKRAKINLAQHLKQNPSTGNVKNVVLVVAESQQIKALGRKRVDTNHPGNKPALRRLPYVGLSTIGVFDPASKCRPEGPAKTSHHNCSAARDPEAFKDSVFAKALLAGKATGIVTNGLVTRSHRYFARGASAKWTNDQEVARDPGADPIECDDLSEQLILGPIGKELKVVLGRGRRNFRDYRLKDERCLKNRRQDRRDLVSEWRKDKLNRQHKPVHAFVWDSNTLRAQNLAKTEYLLGLFTNENKKPNKGDKLPSQGNKKPGSEDNKEEEDKKKPKPDKQKPKPGGDNDDKNKPGSASHENDDKMKPKPGSDKGDKNKPGQISQDNDDIQKPKPGNDKDDKNKPGQVSQDNGDKHKPKPGNDKDEKNKPHHGSQDNDDKHKPKPGNDKDDKNKPHHGSQDNDDKQKPKPGNQGDNNDKKPGQSNQKDEDGKKKPKPGNDCNDDAKNPPSQDSKKPGQNQGEKNENYNDNEKGQKKPKDLNFDDETVRSTTQPRGGKIPTLAELTEAALTVLSKNNQGYLLLVQGDKTGDKNANKLEKALTRILDLTNPQDTLLVVATQEELDADRPCEGVLGGDEEYPEGGSVFSKGPWAQLFTGTFEGSYVYTAIDFAACLGNDATACTRR